MSADIDDGELRDLNKRLDRAETLIRAMVEILDQAAKSRIVENVFDLTAVWDNAECDGACWHEDARIFLDGEE